MAEQTTLTAYIYKKLVEYGWLPSESQSQADFPSPWDSGTTTGWSGFKGQVNHLFLSFFRWARSHGWRFWNPKDQGSLSANEFLPGFMETAESHARLEFDPGRQAWIAHLDYSQKSLACHLDLVTEEGDSIMQQILSTRQIGASPPD